MGSGSLRLAVAAAAAWLVGCPSLDGFSGGDASAPVDATNESTPNDAS